MEDQEDGEDKDDMADPLMDEEDEKHRQMEIFINELPEEIISSKIPEEQQYMLVKILTKQHTFMMGYLEMNLAEGGGGGPSEEEMQKFEQKLEDFQETMEAVQAYFLSLKEQQQASKKANKKKDEEEKKKHEDEDKAQPPASLLDLLVSNPAKKKKDDNTNQQDQEMVDEGAKLGTTENAPKDADKLVPLSDPSLD